MCVCVKTANPKTQGHFGIGGFYTSCVKTANLICENRQSQIGGFCQYSFYQSNWAISARNHIFLPSFWIKFLRLLLKRFDIRAKLESASVSFSLILRCCVIVRGRSLTINKIFFSYCINYDNITLICCPLAAGTLGRFFKNIRSLRSSLFTVK